MTVPYVDKVKNVKKHGGFPTEVSDMARNMKMELLTFSLILNPTGTPGYRHGTESFFGLKGRPSVVRDVEIHNQPVLRMRRK
jgi:hypothetical protein